jgi:hypothetical protein
LVGEADYSHETHGRRLVLHDRQQGVALVGSTCGGVGLGEPPAMMGRPDERAGGLLALD